jgi:arylsulfatase A
MKKSMALCPIFILFLAMINAHAAQKPNIIVYLADDLGYGSINTYGAPESLLKTPHLNELAAQGVQFTNNYTNASVCTPTRYSLLTGEYSWRSRLTKGTIKKNDYSLIDPRKKSIAKYMQDQGYKTAAIGKWHLGYKSSAPVNNLLGDLSPGACGIGFDYHFGVPYNLDDAHKVYIENNRIYGLRSDKINPYGNSSYAKKSDVPKQYIGYDAPQRVVDQVMSTTTSMAIEWIKKQNDDQPFFMYFASVAVHNPIIPSAEMKGKSNAGLYGDFIQEVDHSFGRIVRCVKEKGVLENTLIIFASDNGGQIYKKESPHKTAQDLGLKINGNSRGDKSDIWEGGFKTPLIVSHTGSQIPKGSISDAMVSTIDIYAFLADYVANQNGLMPEDAPDSYSFKKEVFDPGKSSYKRPHLVLSDSLGRKAVRFDNWKFIEKFSQNKKGKMKVDKSRLYDLAKDPLETKNLANEKSELATEGQNLLDGITKASIPKSF